MCWTSQIRKATIDLVVVSSGPGTSDLRPPRLPTSYVSFSSYVFEINNDFYVSDLLSLRKIDRPHLFSVDT